MASFKSIACAAFALMSVANAHFQLTTPTSAGFKDEDEDKSPCGGATLDFDKGTVSDFHVGGQPVGMLSGHTQTNWLFRGTLDKSGSGNWTQLFPILQQSGAGKFCEKAVPAPESWVGMQGLVSVVANGPDGLLYQCVLANFVSGTSDDLTSCQNGTATVSEFSDPTLQGLVSGSSSGDNASTTSGAAPSSTASSSSGTGTSSTASPTPTNAAAVVGPALGSLGLAAMLSMMGLVL